MTTLTTGEVFLRTSTSLPSSSDVMKKFKESLGGQIHGLLFYAVTDQLLIDIEEYTLIRDGFAIQGYPINGR